MASRLPRGAAAPAPQAASNRQNEYFVPRDGIDREVITADICRYLGNDALVRPGTYEDKGRLIQGYYITAYRNLTSAMIADLKADSARWEQERRKHQTGGVRYSDSQYRQVQMSQQQYDQAPSYADRYPPAAPEQQPRYPGSDAPGYSAAAPNFQGGFGNAPGGYSTPQYQQQPPQQYASSQDPSRFGNMPPSAAGNGFPQQQSFPEANPPYMATGAHHAAQGGYSQQDTRMHDAGRPAFPPGQPSYSNNPDPRFAYQPQVQPQGSTNFAAQPLDPNYGRASPATGYSPAPEQPSQYEDPTLSRSSATPSSAPAQIPNSSVPNPRRDRDRDPRESEKHRHHYSSGRR